MSNEWIKWIPSHFPGVRYRKHPTRKNGVQFDRYYSIRYSANGKTKEEALGWATDGWTATMAAEERAQLMRNARLGEGATSLKEKRERVERKKRKRKRDAITFGKIFAEKYFPVTSPEKHPKAASREESLFRKWVGPVISDLPIKDVAPIHLEKIKKDMRDAELSPRSIQYAMAVARQVFNFAYREGLFLGVNPVKKIRIPRADNRRTRYLTMDEADNLLAALKAACKDTWLMALISLHTGLREHEIFRLTWADINIGDGTIMVQGKNGRNRYAHMTSAVKDALVNRVAGTSGDIVFPSPIDGKVRKEISRVFERIVKDQGLNDDVTDRRDRVVFHTLRHTFASWLVENGTDLYTVKELLGHSTLAMTERYAHLSNGKLQQAVQNLEQSIKKHEHDSDIERVDDEEIRLA